MLNFTVGPTTASLPTSITWGQRAMWGSLATQETWYHWKGPAPQHAARIHDATKHVRKERAVSWTIHIIRIRWKMKNENDCTKGPCTEAYITKTCLEIHGRKQQGKNTNKQQSTKTMPRKSDVTRRLRALRSFIGWSTLRITSTQHPQKMEEKQDWENTPGNIVWQTTRRRAV
jgi:hypothetical protein